VKCPYKYFLFIVLPISMACAQGDNSTNSAAASSLIISGDRTQEERIIFLLDVAHAYVNEGDIIATIDAYERILEIDPNNLQARHAVGHTYISAKQYKKAETLLLALIEEYPEDFKLWNNLAWLYATAEDLSIRDGKKATKYAQEAMTLAPNDYHVWSTLSEAHYISGEYEKAYRAVMHMASLAARFGTDITEENVNEYNEQIRKCKRAIDTEEAMKPEEDSSTE
jgi:tetratricopeptide (TPR) repeat protein